MLQKKESTKKESFKIATVRLPAETMKKIRIQAAQQELSHVKLIEKIILDNVK